MNFQRRGCRSGSMEGCQAARLSMAKRPDTLRCAIGIGDHTGGNLGREAERPTLCHTKHMSRTSWTSVVVRQDGGIVGVSVAKTRKLACGDARRDAIHARRVGAVVPDHLTLAHPSFPPHILRARRSISGRALQMHD